jgi:hypothetical protein
MTPVGIKYESISDFESGWGMACYCYSQVKQGRISTEE